MVVKKDRIGYFDLMKGLCIILVLIGHCYDKLDIKIDNVHLWTALEHLRMPLYFFLSGMFFKEYSNMIEFTIKKFNRLIIPFLFFAVISVVPALISGEVEFDLISIKHHITWMLKYAGYLWFLRTLFIANILYYIYNKVVNRFSLKIQVLSLCVLVAIGWCINQLLPQEDVIRRDYGILFSVITSLMVFPYFFVASKIRNFLANLESLKNKNIFAVGLISLVLCFLTAKGGVYLMYAKVENNPISFYVASFSAITLVWSICYLVRHIFAKGYLYYMGRYSIIVYLTHVPILGAIVYSGVLTGIFPIIILMLSVMPVMIWVFKRLFPAFVAQRDLLIYEKGRVKVDFGAFSLKNR